MLKSLVIPLVFTLLMHALLAAVFIIDWSGERTVIKRQQPKVIQAKLVTMEKPKPKPAKKKSKPKPKPKPLAKKEPKPVPKVEPKPVPEPKVDNRQQQARRQAELEQQRLEQLRKEAAEDLFAAVEEEGEARQAETDGELANSAVALITQRVVGQWTRPASARNGMEVELLLHMVPVGDVTSVSVVASSGSDAFDRSALNAVKKAAPFRELQQLPNRVFEENFRRFRMIFRPEDLRR